MDTALAKGLKTTNHNKMLTFTKIYNHLEETLIGFLLAAMTLVTFSQVVARSVFNSGAVWALELTTYLFAWMVLFGVSYGVRAHAHIGVDTFVKLFPNNVQRIIGIIAILCCMAYCILVFIGSWNYVSLMYELGIEAEDLPIQQWIVYLILPIGMTLLFIRFAEVLYKLIVGIEVHMLADEAQEAIEEHMVHEHESLERALDKAEHARHDPKPPKQG